MRWWDGRRWGPTPPEAQAVDWWLAADGRYYPRSLRGVLVAQSWWPRGLSAGGGYHLPAERGGRRRQPWWLVTGPSDLARVKRIKPVVLLIFGGVLVVGPDVWELVADTAASRSDGMTYEEEFSEAGRRDWGGTGGADVAVADGKLVVTLGRSAYTSRRVDSPWPAARVRIDARMGLGEAAAATTHFGVYVTRGDWEQYAFTVSPEFGPQLTGPAMDCQQQAGAAGVRGGEISLVGEYAEADNVMLLTGSVDGRAVATCVADVPDRDAGPLLGAGLRAVSPQAGTTVWVDHVTVTCDRD